MEIPRRQTGPTQCLFQWPQRHSLASAPNAPSGRCWWVILAQEPRGSQGCKPPDSTSWCSKPQPGRGQGARPKQICSSSVLAYWAGWGPASSVGGGILTRDLPPVDIFLKEPSPHLTPGCPAQPRSLSRCLHLHPVTPTSIPAPFPLHLLLIESLGQPPLILSVWIYPTPLLP